MVEFYDSENVRKMLNNECPHCSQNSIGIHKVIERNGDWELNFICDYCGHMVPISKGVYNVNDDYGLLQVYINDNLTNLCLDELSISNKELRLSVHNKPVTFDLLKEKFLYTHQYKKYCNLLRKLLYEKDWWCGKYYNLTVKYSNRLIIIKYHKINEESIGNFFDKKHIIDCVCNGLGISRELTTYIPVNNNECMLIIRI